METLLVIVKIFGFLFAAPFAVILLDKLIFLSMSEENRKGFIEYRKEFTDYFFRKTVTPDDIFNALGRVYQKSSTIHHYRYALLKAVDHITKQRNQS